MSAARRFATWQADSPPLEGWTVARRGGSVATDVAASHFRVLGCGFIDSVERPTSGAGHLSLRLPGDGRRRLRVDCELEWAGPVEASLEDEVSVQAACGIMHVHGRKSGVPVPLGVDYASTVAGVLAGQGALAALVGRLRGLNLRRVTTSVAQAALLSVAQYLAAATAGESCTESMSPGGPPFTSGDGVRFEIEVLDPAGWGRFWASLDVGEMAVRRGWSAFQLRFATATCPLPQELHRAVNRNRFVALVDAADAAGVSILRLRDVGEHGADDAAACPPWRITAMPGTTRAAPRPRSPAPALLPLEGLVVIEACRRLQGPLAGHILRLLGARVIRIEPPGGDLLRGMPPMAGDCSARFLVLNRGKDAVEVDLKSTAGRAAVLDLVAGADVFLHNWAPGRAAQLELDSDHLATVRPGLVYAYASGWGDALGDRPPLGTDFMVQAYSGLAAMIRPADELPAPSLMTLTDILGGLVCAQGVLAGLLARIRSGLGQRVDSSLLSAAMVLQQPVLQRLASSAGRCAARQVWTPLHRPLVTADGYLALPAWARVEPDRVAAACGAGSGFDAIAARVRREPSQTWVERLADAGLAGIPVCTSLAALASDPRFALALEQDICTFTRPPWEFS